MESGNRKAENKLTGSSLWREGSTGGLQPPERSNDRHTLGGMWLENVQNFIKELIKKHIQLFRLKVDWNGLEFMTSWALLPPESTTTPPCCSSHEYVRDSANTSPQFQIHVK